MTGTTTKCICRTVLPLKVCQSYAGYYLGYTCPNCGPYDRVSGYYDDQANAHNALAKLTNQGDTDGDIVDEGHLERVKSLDNYITTLFMLESCSNTPDCQCSYCTQSD